MFNISKLRIRTRDSYKGLISFSNQGFEKKNALRFKFKEIKNLRDIKDTIVIFLFLFKLSFLITM